MTPYEAYADLHNATVRMHDIMQEPDLMRGEFPDVARGALAALHKCNVALGFPSSVNDVARNVGELLPILLRLPQDTPLLLDLALHALAAGVELESKLVDMAFTEGKTSLVIS